MSDRYEEIPYLAGTHAESHPSRIAATARLHGLQAPDLATARVLELGCGRGRNLIPVAADFPGATFVGLDLAENQVADATALAATLGLQNIGFEAADVTTWAGEGPFDYVIAHGLLSWVPPEVATGVLAAIARVLAPQGVAYVSYNCLPGWYRRGVVRDLMRMHAERFDEPVTQVREARAMLKLFSHLAGLEGGWYAQLLKHEHELIADKDDWYVAHDHLETHNHPYYFRDVVAKAAATGLQYLGEADHSRQLPPIPGEVQQALQSAAGDPIRLEQYLDILGFREFRCTLFCHDDLGTWAFPNPEHVEGLYVSGLARPKEKRDVRTDAAVDYTSKRRDFRINAPILKATFQVLAERWPGSIRFDELYRLARAVLGKPGEDAAERRNLAESLVFALSNGVISFDALPDRFVTTIGDRPVASPVARAQLAAGEGWVATGRHATLRLSDLDRSLVSALDGRDRGALLDALWADVQAGRFELTDQRGAVVTDPLAARKRLDALVASRLPLLREHGLLTG